MVHQTGAANYNAMIWIADFNGNVLQQTFTPPLRMWTPYTLNIAGTGSIMSVPSGITSTQQFFRLQARPSE